MISCITFLYGKWKIEEGTAYKDFFIVSSEGIVSENLKNGDVIEQEFSILEDSIRGIAVCFATPPVLFSFLPAPLLFYPALQSSDSAFLHFLH